MRQSIVILLLLLIAWITGSSYWYVCRIRCDCQQNAEMLAPVSQEISENKSVQTEVTPEQTLAASLEEAKSYIKSAGVLTLYFATGSAATETNVIPDKYLKNLKLYLDNQPGSKIIVSGYTDKSGQKSDNLELSKLRAEFVKDFLVKSGIKTAQIQTSYKSDSEPVASNETPDGRSKNRRAEINVLI